MPYSGLAGSRVDIGRVVGEGIRHVGYVDLEL